MKFAAIPDDLLKALKGLREKYPMRLGRDAVISVRASKDGLIVEAYLSTASVPADIIEAGEFFTTWKSFGKLLGTYPRGQQVTFSLEGNGLRMGGLRLPVRAHPDSGQ